MTQEIATRLAQLRRDHGFSQEELARCLGVTRQAVSKWECGESSPDTDNLIALSELYDITLDELLHDRGVSSNAVDAEIKASEAAYSETASPETAHDAGGIDPSNPLPNGSFYDHLERMRHNRFPYPVLVAFGYLVLGFAFHLWHPGWLIFLTIPLYYLPASQRSPLKLLGHPVMVTLIYLLLGCCCNLWHPGWLVFFAIPILNAATLER